MTKGAVVCAACGAKVSAARARCPRCRALLTTAAPPAEARLSARTAAIAGGVLAVACVATVIVLWRADDPLPESRAKPPAPASRPQAAAPVTAEVPPAPPFELASGLTPVAEGADDAAALAGFERALDGDPQNAVVLYSMGRVLLRLRRPHDAIGPLKRASTLNGDDWSYAFSTGYAAALASRFQEALPAFRAARALKPADAVTSYDLALTLQRMGDHAPAAEEYAAAIALNRAAVSPRLGLAIALDRLGKASEAVAAYDEALQLMPPGPDADKVRARVERLRGPDSAGGND